MKTRLYLYDTTLRDGAQTGGVDFDLPGKLAMARKLDDLGVDYIEAGWPGANPVDSALFDDADLMFRHAKLTEFGMTRREYRNQEPRKFRKAICIVGKTRRSDAVNILGLSADENVAMIAAAVRDALPFADEVHFDAEHFFDACVEDQAYALQCIAAAAEAGARFVTLCDTNGGTLPADVGHITKEVCALLAGKTAVGIHCHNDSGLAVACTLAAVEAGATLIQGTINGLGERCGNADLCTIIPLLLLKKPYNERYETGITLAQLQKLTEVSRLLERVINRSVPAGLPFVGRNAFTHKGGLHAASVLKDPATYEHVPPERVGNVRVLPISDQAGRAAVAAALRAAGIDETLLTPTAVADITAQVKQREAAGYAYDSADASFALLARRLLHSAPEPYRVLGYRVVSTHDGSASTHTAQVRLWFDDREHEVEGTGNGPVHALDRALRSSAGPFGARLQGLRLLDFRVSVLSGGTDAITRAHIDFSDALGRRFGTVGVGGSVLDAAFEALNDGIVYVLGA